MLLKLTLQTVKPLRYQMITPRYQREVTVSAVMQTKRDMQIN
jgi:hypothetical protein